jgi:hypothetical protein
MAELRQPPRRCQDFRSDGRPCGAPPMRDNPHCFTHAPETEEERADARRLGGLRRRRERTLVGAYELAGLASVPDIRRLFEIALLDTLALDNSIARSRTLVAIGSAAARLYETSELEQRVAALERATPRPPALPPGSLLDEDDEELDR